MITSRRRSTMVAFTAACALALLAGACSSGSKKVTPPRATTTTRPPRPTTTTAPKPTRADANRDIDAFARTRQGSADVSIGDVASDTVTDVTTRPQTQVRIASVVKVSIAIGILRQMHAQGQSVGSLRMAQLTNMIEQSDNTAAQELWELEDGPEALLVTERTAGLTHTAYQQGHGWGFSLTTAHDQAKLEAALAGGRMLDADGTHLVLDLMHHVVSSEQWGFADSVDAAIAPAIKNGWYEDTDAPVWRIHCTAIFDSPLLEQPFSIAVMTRYPATLGMGYGEDTCRGVAHRLGAWLTRK